MVALLRLLGSYHNHHEISSGRVSEQAMSQIEFGYLSWNRTGLPWLYTPFKNAAPFQYFHKNISHTG
jgi:hypothetical protein